MTEPTPPLEGGIGIEVDSEGGLIHQRTTGVEPGTYQLPTIIVNDTGHITDAEPGALGSDYIQGLGLEYVSATEVRLEVGAAHIPGIDRIISVESPITATVSGGNNAIRYCFLYETNDVGQLRITTIPPDEPYFGTARTQEDDGVTRYLGMLRKDGLGNVMPFQTEVRGGNAMRVWYTHAIASSAELVDISGTNAVQTHNIGPTAAIASHRYVSVSAERALVLIDLEANNINCRIGWAPSNVPPLVVSAGIYSTLEIPLNENQEFRTRFFSGLSNSGFVEVRGYDERR